MEKSVRVLQADVRRLQAQLAEEKRALAALQSEYCKQAMDLRQQKEDYESLCDTLTEWETGKRLPIALFQDQARAKHIAAPRWQVNPGGRG